METAIHPEEAISAGAAPPMDTVPAKVQYGVTSIPVENYMRQFEAVRAPEPKPAPWWRPCRCCL